MFKDRVEAGEKLAEALEKYQDKNTVIYGLPRGGVVVAAKIAQRLQSPLSLIIVRKVGHPYNPEYAICATSENRHLICNKEELAYIDKNWLKKEVKRQQQETKRRRQLYLSGNKSLSSKDKTAIIVDDGIATGLTMLAAIGEVKHQQPRRIIVAVPVTPPDIFEKIKQEVDEIVALELPEEFAGSIGAYYEQFPQVSDGEVVDLMEKYSPKQL